MSSLLVQNKDVIAITTYYQTITNKFGRSFPKIITEEAAKEAAKSPETSKKVNQFVTKWRPQTWQGQNQLYQNSTVYNPNTGSKEIDFSIYRTEMLKTCLIDWDLVDDNGRQIPVTEENISNLHANIASAIIDKYNEYIGLDEEEVKN